MTGWNETLTRFAPHNALAIDVDYLDFGCVINARGIRACGTTLREALNAIAVTQGGTIELVVARVLCRAAIEEYESSFVAAPMVPA